MLIKRRTFPALFLFYTIFITTHIFFLLKIILLIYLSDNLIIKIHDVETSLMDSDNNFEKINWIEDENLLRDEGILFGLSGSGPETKTDIIKSYFEIQNAANKIKLDFFLHQHINIDKLITENENLIVQKINKVEQLLVKQSTQKSFLLRSVFGSVISFFICICNFFIIKYFLSPQFPGNNLISAGIFLAGSFSLFSKISSLYQLNGFHGKLIWLEEIGLPLSASFFVFVWTINHYPVYISLAIFFVIFFLFLFSGKLFLSNLAEIKNEINNYFFEKSFKRNQKEEVKLLKTEVEELKIKISRLIETKATNLEQQVPFAIRFNQIEARRDTLIKIFESEFYLSRSYKMQLSDKQMNTLKTYKSA